MEALLLPRGRFEGEESLEQYRARGGYLGLKKAVQQLSPEAVTELIIRSGLRGRGGAGFPAGKKWSFARETGNYPRYLVCNGGEDEPGSSKDRLLLENHPHLVIEGVILSSFAVEAERAYIYINSQYERAWKTVESALEFARREALWGTHILGSSYSLEVIVHPAPPTYVAGEDSAALEVIEGKTALPRQKPPFPATVGLFGKPTVVNNVETLANVGPIVRKGAEWFRSIGTAESPGTMIFSLGEEMQNPGAYELPFGTSLRTLIEKVGGGLRSGKKIKAVLPGGPSTAFLSASQVDVSLDHVSMNQAGSSLGCGVMKLIPEGSCMVEESLRISEFFAKESCGQCPACRMETSMLAALLKKIQTGEGGEAILGQIPKLIEFNRGKGFCALINMPGPPLLSAIKLYPEDFHHHLEKKGCPYNP